MAVSSCYMTSKVLPEFLNDILFPHKGVLDAIDLTQPQWDTTASATIADGIVVVATPDDGMDKSTIMTIAEDDLCLFFCNATIVLRAFGDKDIAVHTEHDFRLNGVVTFLGDLTAGAGTNRQFRRHIHDFFGFFSLEQICPLQFPPPPVPHPPHQTTKQGNLCPRRPEKIELQGKFAVSAIEFQRVVHPTIRIPQLSF